MALRRLESLVLQGADGHAHQLGGYWEDRPVVLVFLRHFGCLLCRENASLLRERYQDIKDRGGEVVAVGTGDERYANAFVREDHVPFPVLVDDDAAAANAAAVNRIPFLKLLFDPRAWPGGWRARRAGFRIHRSGKRVTQLGATYVIGPGSVMHYDHVDTHSADHAPVGEVIGALPEPR